jgi:hypothetical protein
MMPMPLLWFVVSSYCLTAAMVSLVLMLLVLWLEPELEQEEEL